jgi:hypothetical protein
LRNLIFGIVLLAATAACGQTTFSNVNQMSGWNTCSGCAGGGMNAHYVFQQHVTSPSMDGQALREAINGGTPFSHVLAYKSLGKTNSTIRHFVQDAYIYFDKPQNANGYSIAGHQTLNGKHYRFSTQCSFNKGIWSVWDTGHSRWLATSAPCPRPSAMAWHHITVEAERTTDNHEHFISITVDGVKNYVNKTVSPESKSGNGIGMHLEADGNRAEAPYSMYWDKVSFKVW